VKQLAAYWRAEDGDAAAEGVWQAQAARTRAARVLMAPDF
jgi:hypothetical protein